MTTEEITTSVDADVLSLDEKIEALQAERKELAGKQAEERAEAQKAAFTDIVGGASEILDATGIDLDALKAIGVVGFQLVVKPDADGGPDVTSVSPITSAPVKKAKSTSSAGGVKRDLQGNFEVNATAEQRDQLASIIADGADGNKVYALRLKVWNEHNS